MIKLIKKISIGTFGFFLMCNYVFATTLSTDMGWDKTFSLIIKELSSNVALGIGIISLAACGIAIAVTDLQNGGKRLVTIGIGVSIALTATAVISKFVATGAII